MISNRIMPTDEQLAESRRRLHIPDDWAWTWCANPLCCEWLWYPPGAEEATKQGGLPFFSACSNKCTLSLIQTLPVKAR